MLLQGRHSIKGSLDANVHGSRSADVSNIICLPLQRLRSFLILIGVGAIGVAGCAPDATTTANSPIAGNVAPQVQTIGEILQSDPRFTDFVQVIDFAGLGHRLDNDHNVTVFAPTNAAFQHAEPNWRATGVPDTS